MFSSSVAHAQTKPDVDVWLTNSDRTALLARQSPELKFVAGAGSGTVIQVDDTKRFQQMDGFGYALTGGSAELLMKMQPAKRTELLQELFGVKGSAIGVSYLRVSIGASDMNERVFTYDDLPAGETDPMLAKFGLGPDLQDVVPVLKEILAIDPKIAILASPWTAPSWMKTNELPKGGSLKPEDYEVYAQYFVKYLHAMAAEGITIKAITMQNEPRNPKNTPSMVMTADEQKTFLADALGPALHKAGLKTDVILYDHNCDDPEYPLTALADPKASQYAKGSGFHLYEGTIDAMSKVHDAYPSKDLYFTEQMVIQKDATKPLRVADTVSHLIVGAPRNWSRNVLLWNLAADPDNGPHTPNGGCPICQGAITLDGDQVTRNLAFYTLAHASKFVRPGSVRVESGSSVAGVLPNVAFSTPDKGMVLIVANPGKEQQAFSVEFHHKSFSATLNAGDVATYVWR
nr:glycoside hydrolase family 30 beta sandwich domain-containing protein [Granulicella tundricola]